MEERKGKVEMGQTEEIEILGPNSVTFPRVGPGFVVTDVLPELLPLLAGVGGGPQLPPVESVFTVSPLLIALGNLELHEAWVSGMDTHRSPYRRTQW